MKKTATLKLAIAALLIALNIFFSRFASINAWNIKIGFTFTTVFIAGYLYGPLFGALVGTLGDFLGAILFPIGAYYPGFTLTALIGGLVYGFLLKRNTSIWKTAVAVLFNQLVLSLALNTYWIFVLYNKPSYLLVMSTRIGQCVLMIVVEFVTIQALGKILPSITRGFDE